MSEYYRALSGLWHGFGYVVIHTIVFPSHSNVIGGMYANETTLLRAFGCAHSCWLQLIPSDVILYYEANYLFSHIRALLSEIISVLFGTLTSKGSACSGAYFDRGFELSIPIQLIFLVGLQTPSRSET